MHTPQALMQPIADKAAISLSALCSLHCLLMPIAIAVVPSVASLSLADEAFHYWMVVAVVPISAFALLLGCRRHRRWSVLGIGMTGLLLLCSAVYLGHDVLGDQSERGLTLLGTFAIAASHVQNFRLCRSSQACNNPSGLSD